MPFKLFGVLLRVLEGVPSKDSFFTLMLSGAFRSGLKVSFSLPLILLAPSECSAVTRFTQSISGDGWSPALDPVEALRSSHDEKCPDLSRLASPWLSRGGRWWISPASIHSPRKMIQRQPQRNFLESIFYQYPFQDSLSLFKPSACKYFVFDNGIKT